MCRCRTVVIFAFQHQLGGAAQRRRAPALQPHVPEHDLTAGRLAAAARLRYPLSVTRDACWARRQAQTLLPVVGLIGRV
jgi:hypothetical protein